MSLEISGKLLLKYDTQQVSEKFKKREFVLELAEEINGNIYTNYAKMQLVQNKCEIIDKFNQGDNVKVSFNIKGNKWEKDGKVNYITSLDAWRIEYANNPAANNNNQGGGNNYNQGPNNYNQGGGYNQPQGQPAQSYNNGGNNFQQGAQNPTYNQGYNQGGNTGFNGADQGNDDLPF